MKKTIQLLTFVSISTFAGFTAGFGLKTNEFKLRI
jgi:hypothetical protein